MGGIVKVHNLHRTITKHMIEMVFCRFGEIKRISFGKKNESYALVEFTSSSGARKAISELDSTTLEDINGRNKKLRKAHPEFIWKLSLYKDLLWEEDPRERIEIEKAIVKQKKKNMKYIDSLSAEIEISPAQKQRPIIKHKELSELL